MSEVFEISGEQFVTSKSAARQVGYTPDYVARLAREGKIVAQKIGAVWYVSPDSVNTFFRNSTVEKENWRQELSKFRKQELQNGACASVGTHARATLPKQNQTVSHLPRRATALAQTFAVFIVGLFFGISGYAFSTHSAPTIVQVPATASLKAFARSAYDFFSPDNTTTYRTTYTASARAGDTTSESADTQKDTQKTNPQERYAALVENSFSDEVEVEVDETQPNVATVFPVFGERSEDGYEFVLLPIGGSETVDADFYKSLMARMATSTKSDVASTSGKTASNGASVNERDSNAGAE